MQFMLYYMMFQPHAQASTYCCGAQYGVCVAYCAKHSVLASSMTTIWHFLQYTRPGLICFQFQKVEVPDMNHPGNGQQRTPQGMHLWCKKAWFLQIVFLGGGRCTHSALNTLWDSAMGFGIRVRVFLKVFLYSKLQTTFGTFIMYYDNSWFWLSCCLVYCVGYTQVTHSWCLNNQAF